jgi:phosphoribosyl-ATP pyrophosphohydrolase/phosphoribosyl-AMP cyclohydrolase
MGKDATDINIEEIDFDKGDGLVPAIIQDADDHRVLMLGYMNQSALETTLEKGRVTFYSRSKERLWTKGETSENYLNLVDLQKDCDGDTLLVLARPEGPVCHTGEETCFFEKDFSPSSSSLDFLMGLESLLEDRKENLPEDSYTSSLFRKGIDKIAQKVGEEATETIIASKNSDRDELQYEAADLLFHLMMLLVENDLTLDDIVTELKSRHKIDNEMK